MAINLSSLNGFEDWLVAVVSEDLSAGFEALADRRFVLDELKTAGAADLERSAVQGVPFAHVSGVEVRYRTFEYGSLLLVGHIRLSVRGADEIGGPSGRWRAVEIEGYSSSL
ncbi:hypothetical protein N9F93_00495 [bacterium]|nr:hypothetical protein [bacterium]